MRDCKYHDKTCPCQDGDACHYEDCGDTKAMDPRYVLLARIAALEALLGEAPHDPKCKAVRPLVFKIRTRIEESVMGDEGSSFGATVRRLREQKGIGLRKFAQQVAMSPTYLSKVERDEFNPPSEEKVLAIAEALGTDADVLLGLAGRVASDLAGIIQREPRGMATFLRAANGLSSDELTKLADEIRHRKPSKEFGDKP